MASQQTRPARGMRDFLPEDVRRREYVIGVIADVYQRYGFEPLETPALENIETLTGKYGEEGNKLIFKVLRRGEGESSGETDLALRYDLTVPLARVVADTAESCRSSSSGTRFSRCGAPIVRRAAGFREFYQCDVDAIGSRSMVVETELCAAVSDVLVALGFSDFVIKLNHRRVLTGLLQAAGVPAELHASALVAIDKLDKIGRDGVGRELAERGADPAAVGRVLDTFEGAMTIARARELVAGIPDASAGVEELDQILSLSARTSAAPHVRFDPSLARGLSYYTGAIMEVAVPDLAGSLGGGGRYDGLIGMFLGEEVPACGFSLGLERILVVMVGSGTCSPVDRAGLRGRARVALRRGDRARGVDAGGGTAARGCPRGRLSGAGQAGEADEVRRGPADPVCRDSGRRRDRARRGDAQGPADGTAGVVRAAGRVPASVARASPTPTP